MFMALDAAGTARRSWRKPLDAAFMFGNVFGCGDVGHSTAVQVAFNSEGRLGRQESYDDTQFKQTISNVIDMVNAILQKRRNCQV
jgi:hypothetical protein